MHGAHIGKKLDEASGGNSEPEALELDKIVIAAQRRNLAYDAMQRMTLGQVVDYCIEVDNQDRRAQKKEEKPTIRRMTQDEINAFLG